ncbi:MAG: hypothetical protein ACLTDI_13240 [Acutalibacteraceae bacterium]
MLGYNATPMALNDCFTALQTGVIDGMIGSGAEGYYSRLTGMWRPTICHTMIILRFGTCISIWTNGMR